MNETDWQPTRKGGLRRAGVPQLVKSRTETVGEGNGMGGLPEREIQRGQRQPRRGLFVHKEKSVVRICPPVLGEIRLSWNEKLGITGCEYLTRWGIETRIGSVRVHKWTGPDDDRAFHDHPWWFLTFVLRGGYTDKSPNGEEKVSAPAIRFRPALHQHTVVPYPQGATTLLITGPKMRQWGFWLDGKFRTATKWFYKFGHHPCD